MVTFKIVALAFCTNWNGCTNLLPPEIAAKEFQNSLGRCGKEEENCTRKEKERSKVWGEVECTYFGFEILEGYIKKVPKSDLYFGANSVINCQQQ